MCGGADAGLRDARVEAEVADEVACAAEALRVPDRCQEARGDDHVDPGHRHQPLDLFALEGGLGDQLLDRGDLLVEKVDLADPRVRLLGLLRRRTPARDGPPLLSRTAPLPPPFGVYFDGHETITMTMDHSPGAVLSPVDGGCPEAHFVCLAVDLASEML